MTKDNNSWKYRHFFWSSWAIQNTWNYERQMNMGYLYGMAPILDEIYKDNAPETIEMKKEAYHRHMQLFNCTPQTTSLVMGITAAMEEAYAENPDEVQPESIANIKTSLMGPLSGIGDSFFQGTVRIIAFGLGISFAKQGNILGPILAMIISFIPSFLVTYYGGKIGYKEGAKSIDKLLKGGLMDQVFYVTSVAGLFVIGGMIVNLIGLTTPLTFGENFVLQDTLDTIMPGILPLFSTLLMFWLTKKKVNTLLILAIIIISGILLSYFGILA
ncbi:PTS system mannose/fructose/sorbose family transporter subunit IID [Helcococcus kunzii]|uniref:PTS system mannose/fructose/sorbose family transporter subunit IID n=1 Tax=Helcococcus kunzii TaxID=40091 RepID=UPI0024AC9016|nr:PTS system mannose/fructose/sorbose family transporter subunit IID [Helcococcus kunzii]